jgi:hypothetical protein
MIKFRPSYGIWNFSCGEDSSGGLLGCHRVVWYKVTTVMHVYHSLKGDTWNRPESELGRADVG